MASDKTAPARSTLRARLEWLARTPLHPQWLMPRRRLAPALLRCDGLILDIGSADRWLEAVLPPGARYVALDYPTTALGMYGTRPDVLADAQRLPFADLSVDAVACFEVLEHVADPDTVCREIARVLSPGGIVNLSMPFLYPVHDAPFDFQRWTSHGWRRSLAAVDLEVERIEAANHPLHAGAVLLALSLAGPLQAMRGWGRLWRLPLVVICVFSVNVLAWALAYVWPRWDAMTTTHHVVARKRP